MPKLKTKIRHFGWFLNTVKLENDGKMDKIDKLAQNRQNGKNDEIRQTTFIAPHLWPKKLLKLPFYNL